MVPSDLDDELQAQPNVKPKDKTLARDFKLDKCSYVYKAKNFKLNN